MCKHITLVCIVDKADHCVEPTGSVQDFREMALTSLRGLKRTDSASNQFLRPETTVSLACHQPTIAVTSHHFRVRGAQPLEQDSVFLAGASLGNRCRRLPDKGMSPLRPILATRLPGLRRNEIT
jgi:hypothetical protein